MLNDTGHPVHHEDDGSEFDERSEDSEEGEAGHGHLPIEDGQHELGWAQANGGWDDPDGGPTLSSRLMHYAETTAVRHALAIELGTKFHELLTDVFVDPIVIMSMLIDHPVVLGGRSLEGFLRWRSFLLTTPWQLEPNCRIELFAPFASFDIVDATLQSQDQGWERVKECSLTPRARAEDDYTFIASGRYSTMWVYQREANGFRMTVVLADLLQCTSRLPFASFTRCCNMKLCRIVWPSPGFLAVAADEVLEHTRPHFLHGKQDVDICEDMMDVEIGVQIGISLSWPAQSQDDDAGSYVDLCRAIDGYHHGEQEQVGYTGKSTRVRQLVLGVARQGRVSLTHETSNLSDVGGDLAQLHDHVAPRRTQLAEEKVQGHCGWGGSHEKRGARRTMKVTFIVLPRRDKDRLRLGDRKGVEGAVGPLSGGQ
ncbi:hypothetical protein SISSUDRAFT_1036223 [Sistotremastrum suecicum HHB10207 ss-3]|uniref:Uncharacterized protein n=1 Tax=Sistotremastrum suecicum HHB10207 ss-3 TaxID=1314776 RepID=A0A165ZPZ7_9AGAM|nr:hypothetical protein SISSUDRAFT_1036223 [Sistotremastrum suecicum HHB10207 ss-3]